MVLDLLRKAFHQHAAEHGLAAAHLAGDLHHAFRRGDRVEQRLERGAAVRAREEELRVRRDAERRLAQPEVLQVHRHGCGERGRRFLVLVISRAPRPYLMERS
jgi:hypothetical protein